MKQVLGVDVQSTFMKEPVLDVPAIDMTEAFVPSKKDSRSNPKAKATTRSATTRRQPSKTTQAEKPKGTRVGSVGRETFEQVEALLKQGKNKTEAFKLIAEDTGKNSGTVAANYYRGARANGAVKLRQRRGKASTAASPRRRQKAAQTVTRGSGASPGDSVDQIVGQLVVNVHALTDAVKAQDAEIRELSGRLDGVRSLSG